MTNVVNMANRVRGLPAKFTVLETKKINILEIESLAKQFRAAKGWIFIPCSVVLVMGILRTWGITRSHVRAD